MPPCPPSKLPGACASCWKTRAAWERTRRGRCRMRAQQREDIRRLEECRRVQSGRGFEKRVRKTPRNKSGPARAGKASGEAGGLMGLAANRTASEARKRDSNPFGRHYTEVDELHAGDIPRTKIIWCAKR